MNKKAFTLVELSVSIMIIGLLIALITGSSSLLANAKTNKLIREVLTIKQSFSLFETTYDALPGDFNNAYSYWGEECDQSESDCNGNGNGEITTTAVTGESNNESQYVFHHLNLSGILKRGSYTPGTDESYEYDFTFYSYDTQGVVYYPDTTTNFPEGAKNYLQIGTGASEDGAYIVPKWAHKLDKKVDDGLPRTGVITIFADTTDVTADGINMTCTGDGTTSSNVYQLSNEEIACNTLYDLDS
jgi:prepilin-type N-terminal cleavage/methylation domain-containing protein